MSSYNVEPTEKGWVVVCPDGGWANDTVFKTEKEASSVCELLEKLYGEGDATE